MWTEIYLIHCVVLPLRTVCLIDHMIIARSRQMMLMDFLLAAVGMQSIGDLCTVLYLDNGRIMAL